MISKKIILGTRGSPLALAQANIVIEKLRCFFPDIDINLKIIKTLGDQLKDQPLKDIGGKTVFTKELQESLLKHEIDLAVHSMKDLEMPLPRGLKVASVLKRDDPRDAFISSSGKKLKDLPSGSRVGTCSPRRIAQALSYRPDLKTVLMRGNINTRLKKLFAGECEAIILACAGLNRLHLTEIITEILSPEIMVPAVAQGSIGVEVRDSDEEIKKILHHINDNETESLIRVEHQLLRGFEGNCDTPIAGWARYFPTLEEGIMKLDAIAATLDGQHIIRKTIVGEEENLLTKAFSLGQELKEWYTQKLIF